MNDPAKGGSAYLQQKIAAARDSLVDVTPEPEKRKAPAPVEKTDAASSGGSGAGKKKRGMTGWQEGTGGKA